MNTKLTSLGLVRDPTYGVGKKIGTKTWMHLDYALGIIPSKLLTSGLQELSNAFIPNLIRYDSKTQEIVFIECPDFNLVDEPVMGRYFSFSGPGTGMLSHSSSLVYHHKWLMVRDEYTGFNVELAKERSVRWKLASPRDKSFHSKIGHLSFWRQWSKCLNTHDYLWTLNHQEFTSKTTSINVTRPPKIIGQINTLFGWKPGTRNLDLGGGRYDSGTNILADLGVQNLIYDPFNRDKEHNSVVLDSIINSPVDTVTCSNVLNVIKEPEAKSQIVRQAYHSLKPRGKLYINVYPGKGHGISSPTGKDRWQDHKKIEHYEGLLLSVFEQVEKVKDFYICKK